MSDTQNTNQEQVQEQVETREYTPIELEAIDQGWIPKEEFDGDESKFIDAPEFVRRGELFRKIESSSREVKQLRAALEAFKVHHSKVKEAEYNRALKALQDARKQAFIDGEHERAFAFEEKIDEIKAEKDAVVKEAQVPVVEDTGYTQEFQSWVERNDWYETNRVMRKAADALGIDLAREGHSPQDVLKMVEKEIRKEFSHKFQNPATNRPTAVEPSSRAGTKSDGFVMSADEKEMMRKIVATGVMSEADYIKDLKATRSK
jgi:hypothetical protein